MTTIAATITAYGLLDRRQYLAATYGAMATQLSRISEVFSNGTVNFSALVNTAEDLLQGEHAAWTERMTQSIAASRKGQKTRQNRLRPILNAALLATPSPPFGSKSVPGVSLH